MSVIILGSSGMLGSDILTEFKNNKISVTGLSSRDIDITSQKSIETTLENYPAIKLIINCAAYTAVDNCETETKRALSVNGTGPGLLANYCAKHNITLIHFSTDYVFDGKKEEPYIESDPTNPINIYGQSKLKGEKLIQESTCSYYIFRVQWLFGENGNHFIKTIIRLANERTELKIVNDQWGSPTYTKDIAKTVFEFLELSPAFGIYNLANQEYCNWYDFAKKIVELKKLNCTIYPQPSEAYPVPATRPKNSRLNCEKLYNTGVSKLRTWQEACKEFILDK